MPEEYRLEVTHLGREWNVEIWSTVDGDHMPRYLGDAQHDDLPTALAIAGRCILEL